MRASERLLRPAWPGNAMRCKHVAMDELTLGPTSRPSPSRTGGTWSTGSSRAVARTADPDGAARASSDWSRRPTTGCASSRSTRRRCPAPPPDPRPAGARAVHEGTRRRSAPRTAAGTSASVSWPRDDADGDRAAGPRRAGAGRHLDRPRPDLAHAIDADWLDAALDGVHLELMTIVLDAGPRWADGRRRVGRGVVAPRPRPDGGRGASLGADPVGNGRPAAERVDLEALTADTVRWAARGQRSAPPRHHRRRRRVPPPRGRVAVTSTSWRTSLALGVHHLRTLTGSGLDVDAAARQLEFRFAATPDQFLTIAKLRAARRLWHRVAERRRRRRHPPAPARRDVARRHVALRHLGQRAAQHGRLLRRRRRRRRRRDGAAPRRADRRRAVRRPVAAWPATRSSCSSRSRTSPGRRPGRRVVVRRAPHRPAGPGRVGCVPGPRAGGRRRRRAARRAGAGARGPSA